MPAVRFRRHDGGEALAGVEPEPPPDRRKWDAFVLGVRAGEFDHFVEGVPESGRNE